MAEHNGSQLNESCFSVGIFFFFLFDYLTQTVITSNHDQLVALKYSESSHHSICDLLVGYFDLHFKEISQILEDVPCCVDLYVSGFLVLIIMCS